MVLDDSVKQD